MRGRDPANIRETATPGHAMRATIADTSWGCAVERTPRATDGHDDMRVVNQTTRHPIHTL